MSEDKTNSPSGKMGGEEKQVSRLSGVWKLGWLPRVPALLTRRGGKREAGSGGGRWRSWVRQSSLGQESSVPKAGWGFAAHVWVHPHLQMRL